MSALAGVFGSAAGESGGAIRDMLAAMQRWASGAPEQESSLGAIVAAARHDWEANAGGWSGPLIVSDDVWTVAADANLYYQADLRRRLSTTPRTGNTGELLLLALRQWGPRFARYIEGDYAIMAVERRSGDVLLVRDFGGRKNLVYAQVGRSLVVGSSPTAVIRHPDVSAELDEVFIACAAVNVFPHGPRTAFRHVVAVPGGSTLRFSGAQVSQIARWMPPAFGAGWEHSVSPAAAEELRTLLVDATRERLGGNGPTTVWMSGGWDSTAVFASGKAALQKTRFADQLLRPISASLPTDDRDYEDDHIAAIGNHWSTEIDWIPMDGTPLIADGEARARARDDPMVHPFESILRTLSKRSVALGSRVALDGFGGDHLFLVSGSALVADHIFYGRWSELREVWRTWEGGLREFTRRVTLPMLSPSVRRWIGSVRGRPLAGYLDRQLPSWILCGARIQAELEPEFERLPGEGAAEFESRFMVTNSFVARCSAFNHCIGLANGVSVRGPLFDQRVITFATQRPLSDRGSAGDAKRILRSAMTGLLPESVLAPRSRKTGTTIGYVRRQLQGALYREVLSRFGRNSSVLERMGIVDGRMLISEAEVHSRTGDHVLGALVFSALEVERWLCEYLRARH